VAEIIVVDDAPDVRAMVAEALALAGHAVRGAGDGASLRRLVAERPPDLVEHDEALPGGEDGFRLARWLRERHDPVGILLLTGAADTAVDRVVGLEVGADDHLAKPCAIAELRARVDAVLRRRGGGGRAGTAAAAAAPALPEGVVPFGPRHRFDARRFVLTRAGDGAVVPLLETELDLVAAFALHPGRALSRAELLRLAPPRDGGRGGGDGVLERSVDNRVARLRRKLEADPARPALIKTVRGGGYVHPGGAGGDGGGG
jgi:DNA-binding response OmpR family regulator